MQTMHLRILQRCAVINLLLIGVAHSMSCGSTKPDSIEVLVNLPPVPSDTASITIEASLDGRRAMQPFSLGSHFSGFGVRLPVNTSGALALAIDAHDAGGCKVATAQAVTPIGPPYQTELTAALTVLTTPQCPVPPPPPCAPNVFCTSDTMGNTNEIRSIYGFSARDVWAVGSAGLIMHYDGTSWTKTPPATSGANSTQNLNGVWGFKSNDIWVVGDNRQLLRYNLGSWFNNNIGNANVKDITSIWGIDNLEVWYTASSQLTNECYIIDRINGAEMVMILSGCTAAPNAIWGSGNNNVWAVGTTLTVNISKATGSPMAMVNTALGRLLSIWGAGPSDIWAVGDNGLVRRYNGSTWNVQNNIGSTMNFTGVWGSRPDDVWIVGNGGTTLRFNGMGWSQAQSGTSVKLNTIWGLNTADVWAGGAMGTVLHTLK